MGIVIFNIIFLVLLFLLSQLFNFEVNWVTFLIFFIGIPVSKRVFDSFHQKRNRANQKG